MKQIDVTSEITKLFYNLFNHTDKITYTNDNTIVFKINDVKIQVIYTKTSKDATCNINVNSELERPLFFVDYCVGSKNDHERRFKVYINDDLYVLPKFNRVEEAELLENFENIILAYKHSQINKLISLTSEDEEL